MSCDRSNPSLGVMPPLIELQLPVLQQLTPDALLGEDCPIISFKIRPLFEVIEMRRDATDRSGATRYLDLS